MPTTRLAPNLTLFVSKGCPECAQVLQVLERLDLEVGISNIDRDPDARMRLSEALGETSVPVLHVSGDFEDNWIPGATKVVRYLNQKFGPRPKTV